MMQIEISVYGVYVRHWACALKKKFFFSSATDQQYGIRTNFRQLAKLHGHTNEHVQFEGGARARASLNIITH